MNNTSEPKIRSKYLFCNKCKGETEHMNDSEHYRDYPTYVDKNTIGLVERIGYRLWKCSGCKACSLEEYYIFDILSEDYKVESNWDFKYYPARNEFQIESKNFIQLGKLTKIYREILGAYNNDLNVLCAVGIRALLEGICGDKQIEGRDLKQRINNMDTILPKNIVSNLHSIRFIGNEAAHQLTPPSKVELRLAIELCEDILNFLYMLDYKARALAAARDTRKKEQKAKLTVKAKINKQVIPKK